MALKEFDKYFYYRNSVQSPESDVIFIRNVYRELKKKSAFILGEDFSGGFALCCEWVKLNKNHQAYAVDRDPEPLAYGKQNYLSQLKDSQQSRLHIHEASVLDPQLPSVDILLAMNFSYFLFKTRDMMKLYFRNALSRLNPGGIFILDLFGGSLCQDAVEEKTKHRGFTYYWDQKSFDPVTNDAHFAIHFKRDGEKKREDVFTYDWRMWSIPELKEILIEEGFHNTHVYWEGTNRKGGGNGVFTRVKQGEACLSWIAYIVAEK